jgi:AraC-like DNA-binding protein
MSIVLAIIAYNEFVLYGHQNVYLNKLTLPLTYTDALVFYLIMPLFYVYLLNLVKERPFLSIKNARHLWVALPGFIYSIYFGTLPKPQQEQTVFGSSCGSLPDSLLYIAGSFSIFFYIFLSLRLLTSHIDKNKGLLQPQSLRQLNMYVWVLYLYIFLNVGFITLSLLLPSSADIHSIILSLLVFLTLIQLYVVFYIKPEKLNYIQQSSVSNILKTEIGPYPEKDEATRIIITNINKLFEEKRLFLKHDLDLELLAKSTKIPCYKISSGIRDHYNMTVPDYINNYRIEHAKKILSSEEADQIKIDVLAYECGYSSRSNFYRIFKKITGVTPLEYKDHHKHSII